MLKRLQLAVLLFIGCSVTLLHADDSFGRKDSLYRDYLDPSTSYHEPYVLLDQAASSSDFTETLTATPRQISAVGCVIDGFNIINTNTVPVYVHKYNALSAGVTVGVTTQADAPWAIPANGVLFVPRNGFTHGRFATALTIAATTSPLSSVSTAPTTGLVISISYH